MDLRRGGSVTRERGVDGGMETGGGIISDEEGKTKPAISIGVSLAQDFRDKEKSSNVYGLK